jgi:hypothetical protein
MGDTISTSISASDEMEKYLSKLLFVQNIDDPHFGAI